MWIPEPLRRPLKAVARPWLDYRASRERSVKNIARSNDRAAFELIYGEPDLLEEYLGPERLAFYEAVAEVCARWSPRTIVDVGCGTGHLLAAALRRVPDIDRVVGIDQAEAAIARLAETVPSAEGIVGDIYDLSVPGPGFDLVLCTEVLEHLARPSAALDELANLCAPGGVIVVTVPDGELDTYEGHVNFWNEDEFGRLLAAFGEVDVERVDSDVLLGVLRPQARV